ncbi:hypothetical protein HUA74_12035 [Myxococcus sp. CA051A]|uniref:hypothetical protein n=1 Tax=unclassified Myxococcus TaxID=2648731 RepID=UPI00157A63E4|nr:MULTISPECIES: hypothetical protein [unclassified Myxococcus]NTX09183.1 hypothetical protein [Myxococcus sp. CA056]NTX39705.1 hypothetical protein [Myxococcus sp. CA033]NTX58200.1 hypothetical protein [Myxococcus sp. CA039A]NTX61398.1 hypothetical protein [Myxococcus sp. CA051A]
MRFWMLPLLVLLTSCGLDLAPLARTVHVFVPEDEDAHVPVLYLEKGHALFFPDGVGGGASPVEPRPSELVALGQRRDIVIIAVDTEPLLHQEALPDGRMRYITHLGGP